MTITQDTRRSPATRGNGGPLAGGSQALTSDQLTHRAARAAMAAARWAARKIASLWRALPGPWWVKAPILVACLLVPGPLDELAVIALAGFLAVRKARAAR